MTLLHFLGIHEGHEEDEGIFLFVIFVDSAKIFHPRTPPWRHPRRRGEAVAPIELRMLSMGATASPLPHIANHDERIMAPARPQKRAFQPP
jgi:hypothetical protein